MNSLYNRYPYNTALTSTASTLYSPYGTFNSAVNPAYNPYSNLYNTYNTYTGQAAYYPGRKRRKELLANNAYCRFPPLLLPCAY